MNALARIVEISRLPKTANLHNLLDTDGARAGAGWRSGTARLGTARGIGVGVTATPLEGVRVTGTPEEADEGVRG